MKTLAFGTIYTNCQGFPRTSVTEMKWEIKLLFMQWIDTQEVKKCSTMHKVYDGDTVLRRPEGVWERCQIPISAKVKDYNKYTGGYLDTIMSCTNFCLFILLTFLWKTVFLSTSICQKLRIKVFSAKRNLERLVSELATQSSTSDAPVPSTSAKSVGEWCYFLEFSSFV